MELKILIDFFLKKEKFGNLEFFEGFENFDFFLKNLEILNFFKELKILNFFFFFFEKFRNLEFFQGIENFDWRFFFLFKAT